MSASMRLQSELENANSVANRIYNLNSQYHGGLHPDFAAGAVDEAFRVITLNDHPVVALDSDYFLASFKAYLSI